MTPKMPTESTPTATRHPRRKLSLWFWLLPIFAVVGAAAMMMKSENDRGPLIEISFQQGYGLKVGEALRYRDIEVGRVETIQLSETMDHIRVGVRLHAAAKALAREGSRFWIVHPELSLMGTRGLDTVVGPKYMEVLPDKNETPAFTFVGLESPPLTDQPRETGVEILLLADQADSLRTGAPVTFRDLPVGIVTALNLSTNLHAVEIHARIFDQYQSLITEKTRFWQRGAASVRGGLFKGMTLDIGSMEEIMMGGVALAVPPGEPGKPVAPQTRFRLARDPDKDWLEWLEMPDPAKNREKPNK